ncbi:hypothetical protein DL768_008406 [Monosporascus sp. mg162]|nr:hypothetical protein DL768_008406 [Monosporascus sp. mg162]
MGVLDADSYPSPERWPAAYFGKEQEIALTHFKDYLSQPADDKPFVFDETPKKRDRLWERWIQYVVEALVAVSICFVVMFSCLSYLKHNPLTASPYRICTKLEVDHREAWSGFVRHPEDPKAQAPFKSFLSTYVKSSKRKVVVLGPQEYEEKRMFNSAHSLTKVWRRLVASGEYHVTGALSLLTHADRNKTAKTSGKSAATRAKPTSNQLTRE